MDPSDVEFWNLLCFVYVDNDTSQVRWQTTGTAYQQHATTYCIDLNDLPCIWHHLMQHFQLVLLGAHAAQQLSW